MNEVALHRGRHPHLTVVDAYFDGQHLTEAVVSAAWLHHFTSGRPRIGFMLLPLLLLATGGCVLPRAFDLPVPPR
jgi:hypothetical protein